MSGVWQCGDHRLSLDDALVMGILNVTPDSFSDGGEHDDPAMAIAHARRMASEGAAIVDVGGESTRPGSAEVTSAEEMARTVPVVATLTRELHVPVSIDTRHADVARAAVDAGASIINDVSGFRDPAMVGVAAACDAGLVVMHMLGEPRTMQAEPHYDDVVAEVVRYLLGQAETLQAAGIAHDRICLDPGIGFGKTLDHNLALLRELPQLVAAGYPVLVGASRKSMIGALLGQPDPATRLEGSLAIALWAAARGADIVRVHDVAQTVRALTVWRAIKGDSE